MAIFVTNSKVYKKKSHFFSNDFFPVVCLRKDKARNYDTSWLSIINIQIYNWFSFRWKWFFLFISMIQFYIKQDAFLPAFIIQKRTFLDNITLQRNVLSVRLKKIQFALYLLNCTNTLQSCSCEISSFILMTDIHLLW